MADEEAEVVEGPTTYNNVMIDKSLKIQMFSVPRSTESATRLMRLMGNQLDPKMITMAINILFILLFLAASSCFWRAVLTMINIIMCVKLSHPCQTKYRMCLILQGVPQYCSHFCFVNFSASKASINSILDIFQQPFSCRFKNYPICY